MNLNDNDLNKEDYKQKIRAAIKMYQLQVEEAERKRKEWEEKSYNLEQQLKMKDQKLVSVEHLMRRKTDEFIILGQQNDQLLKRIEGLEQMVKQKPKGIMGIFKAAQKEQELQQHVVDLEQEIEIKNSEIERVHEALFELKSQLSSKDEFYEKKLQILKTDLLGAEEQLEQARTEKQALSEGLFAKQAESQKLQQRLQELQQTLNSLDDQIRIQRDQISQGQQQYLEMQNTLVQKQDEIKRNYIDQEQLKQTLNKLKDLLFQLIPQLESELPSQQSLSGLKQYVDQVFGPDKHKEGRLKVIKQEKELQKELLVSKSAYEVFEKAKEKIIKLGKQIEQLEKKNKLLQDKLALYEIKRASHKSEVLSDRTSVI